MAANLAAVEGFLCGGFEALANGVVRVVHIEAQTAELLLDHNEDSGFCVLRVKTKGHREEATV
jgi:hypothetical protein